MEKRVDTKLEQKKQREFFGFGEIERLAEVVSEYHPKAIFLVTGKKSYRGSAAEKLISDSDKFKFVHFDDFVQNPKIEDIRKGIEMFKNNHCDLCLAIGGGSAIDIAKAINILSAQSEPPEKYITGELKIEKTGAPLVVVPTTAGTGSEATHFAVVYIDKTKHSLAHKEFILPDIVIVDPDLAKNLPPKVTAETGMDALAQGIEAYWSVNSTEESKNYARAAIELAFNNIEIATNQPNRSARTAMARAANLSGKAINIAQTTACHAISYPMTSYFDIPHGHAAALTLGGLLVYNSEVMVEDAADKRGVDYVRKTVHEIMTLLGAQTAEDARSRIRDKMLKIGLATRLSAVGVDRAGIEIIVKNGFNPARMKNNPRKVTEDALRKILVALI